ncbi:MAG TPA: hormogonium polysaccharide biosynthesis protein HpsL [Candidatus Obscuribacterales bacterium]
MPKLKTKSQKSKKSQQQSEAPTLSLKEQLVQKRKAAQERKEFIGVFTATLFASVLLGILIFPLGGAKVAAGAAAAVLCIALSYKYPRKALWAFLIYMPFAGTVTYSIGGGGVTFQLAKDAFYVPALLALIQYCQSKRLPILLPKELKPILGIMVVISLITLLLVNGFQQLSADRGDDQPILMGLLGLKVLLGYLPLITCAYYLIRSKRELLFLTRLHVVLAIVCCVLALIQYYFLATGRCEGTRYLSGELLFKASLKARCFVGGSLLYTPEEGLIRLPGTFVAPWQWGWFLISNAFFTFATAFNDPSVFRWRPIGLVGMAAVFIMSLVSGQRVALVLVPVVTLLLLVITGQVVKVKRFIPIAAGLALILGVGMIMYPDIVQERVQSFTNRWNSSPPADFITQQAEFTSKEQTGFLGHGLGRATNSARTLGKGVLIETYYPKLFYEIGPLGVLAFLGLVTTLTVITFKSYRSIKDQNLRSFGASFWVFILVISYNTYYYPLDVDPVAIYYWFFAGVILKLPELERQEPQEAEVEQKVKKKRSRTVRLSSNQA